MPKKKKNLDKDTSESIIVVKRDDGREEPMVMFNFELVSYVR